MNLTSGALVGFFLGFVFGVGCALAVMYSIYMGGYRAAVREMRLATPPARLREALVRVDAELKDEATRREEA